MSTNTVTLDDIRAAAEAKYASYDITLPDGDVAALRNPLRMPKEERDELRALQDRLNDEGAEDDQEALLADAIRVVIGKRNKQQATKLLREVGDDLAMLAAIFEGYMETQQVGEASASAS